MFTPLQTSLYASHSLHLIQNFSILILERQFETLFFYAPQICMLPNVGGMDTYPIVRSSSILISHQSLLMSIQVYMTETYG